MQNQKRNYRNIYNIYNRDIPIYDKLFTNNKNVCINSKSM